ncbi:13658_t:CDS:1, partial [Racocetra fulgida]
MILDARARFEVIFPPCSKSANIKTSKKLCIEAIDVKSFPKSKKIK